MSSGAEESKIKIQKSIESCQESVHCISGYKICAAVRFPSSRPMMVQHLPNEEMK